MAGEGARCEAECAGLTCVRQAGHGELHVDPKYAQRDNCNLWIMEPCSDEEIFGHKPYSGYRLLTDVTRPAGGS